MKKILSIILALTMLLNIAFPSSVIYASDDETTVETTVDSTEEAATETAGSAESPNATEEGESKETADADSQTVSDPTEEQADNTQDNNTQDHNTQEEKTQEEAEEDDMDLRLARFADLRRVPKELDDDTMKSFVSESAILQDGNVIEAGSQVDITKPITVRFKLKIPVAGDENVVNPVMKGDTGKLLIGKGIKLVDGQNTKIELVGPTFTPQGATQEIRAKVAGLELKQEDPNNTMRAYITFDGDDEVYNGTLYDVEAWFMAKFEVVHNDDGTANTEFELAIMEKTYTYQIENQERITLSKSGVADIDNRFVEWTVVVERKKQFNANSVQYLDLKDYTLEDNRIAAGAYIPDSLTVNGQPANFTVDQDKLLYQFPENSNDKQTLVFRTELTPKEIYASYVTFKKVNEVRLIAPDNSEAHPVVKAEVEVRRAGWISKGISTRRSHNPNLKNKDGSIKTSYPDYDKERADAGYMIPNTNHIQWYININHSGRKIEDVVITDTIPEHTTFDPSYYIWMQWDEAQNKWINIPKLNTEEPTVNGRDVIFKVKKIDKFVRLFLVTEVTDTSYFGTIFTNKVNIKWKDHPKPEGYNAEVSTLYGNGGLVKSSSGLEAGTSKINWKIEVKAEDMKNLTAPVVYDLLIFKKFTAGQADGKYRGYHMSATELAKATGYPDAVKNHWKDLIPIYLDYQLYIPKNPAPSNVVVHPIKYEGEHVADLLEIKIADKTKDFSFEYQTETTHQAEIVTDAVNGHDVNNMAVLFDGNTVVARSAAGRVYPSRLLGKDMLPAERVPDFIREPSADNGNQFTRDEVKGFNHQTKSVIYRLSLNGDNHQHLVTALDNGRERFTMTDILPEGWEIVPFALNGHFHDFLVFTADALTDQNKKAAERMHIDKVSLTAKGNPQTSIDGMEVEKGKQGVHNTISFRFTKNLTGPYVFYIQARPSDAKLEEYYNSKDLTEAANVVEVATKLYYGKNGTELRRKSQQKVIFDNRLLTKKALTDAANHTDGIVKWEIKYNPRKVVTSLPQLVIKDQLSKGLELRENGGKLDLSSFSLTEYAVNSDGSLVEPGIAVTLTEGGNLKYDKTKMLLELTLPDKEKAYVFKYSTDITGKPGDLVSNKVWAEGMQTTITPSSDSYEIATLDGGANYKLNALVEITKVSEADENVKLAGAEFTLTVNEPGKPARTLTTTTANDGLARFTRLPAGEHILVESKAPEGYEKSNIEYVVRVEKKTEADVRVWVGVPGSTLIESKSLKVTNKQITEANLRIVKKVEGTGADLAKKFRFTVSFSGTGADKEYEVEPTSITANGKIKSGDTFELSHGQQLTIKKLPIGMSYTITEENYESQGYTLTTQTNASGTIVLKPAEVEFVNTYTGKSLTVVKKWHHENKQPKDVKVKLVSRIDTTAEYSPVIDSAKRITAVYTQTDGGAEYEAVNEGQNDEVVFTLPSVAFGGKLIIRNLPPVDTNGNIIHYSVVEVVDAANSEYMAFVDSGATNYDKILHNIETTPLKVTKEWITTNHPKQEVTLALKQVVSGANEDFEAQFAKSIKELNGDKLTATLVAPADVKTKFTFTLKEGNWSTDLVLPKFGKDGVKIVYAVEEVKVDGFHKAIVKPIENNEIKVINVSDETTEVTVTKAWLHPQGTAAREIQVQLLANGQPAKNITGKEDTVTLSAGNLSHIFRELPLYTKEGQVIGYTVKELTVIDGYITGYEGQGSSQVTINNIRAGKIKIVTVTKKWVGPEGQGVNVQLYRQSINVAKEKVGAPVLLNANTGWKHEFMDLPEFDSKGQPFTYSVEETGVDKTRYNVSYSGNQTAGFVITNTNKEEIRIKVTKKWFAPTDKIPDSLAVTLTSDAGYHQSVTLTKNSTPEAWSHTFSNLPRYKANGSQIVYTLTETKPDNFNLSVEGLDNQNHVLISELAPADGQVTGVGNVVLNNTIKGKISISVTKQWLGAVTAKNIEVGVFRQGETTAVQKATLTGANSNNAVWSHTFNDLDEYNGSGVAYVYEVREIAIDGVPVQNGMAAGYKVTVDGNVIKNYNTEKINIPVTKIWVGKVPASISFKIKAGTSYVQENGTDMVLTLTANNVSGGTDTDANLNEVTWYGEFKNLPKYDETNGKEIQYTVEEIKPDGYTLVEQANNTFKNISQETIDIPVEKKWVNSSIAEVTVRLWNGSTEVGTLKLNEKDGWKRSFTGLPKFDKASGAEIIYTLTEDVVPNFKTEIKGDKAAGFTVTNTYIPPLEPYNPPGGDTPDKPTPSDEPTPKEPTPPTEDVPNEPTPEGEPNKPTPPTPPVPNVPEEEIPTEPIPEGKTELPKTDGIPAGAMHIFGLAMAAIGLLLKKKK
ncbi:MAG: Cna B-type domain-containing protein [Eubacteriales bacterium]|nr:Cna B-type domain-containing protein [Eubacteriales bacterium]